MWVYICVICTKCPVNINSGYNFHFNFLKWHLENPIRNLMLIFCWLDTHHCCCLFSFCRSVITYPCTTKNIVFFVSLGDVFYLHGHCMLMTSAIWELASFHGDFAQWSLWFCRDSRYEILAAVVTSLLKTTFKHKPKSLLMSNNGFNNKLKHSKVYQE